MRRPEKPPLKLTSARLRWLDQQVAAGKFKSLNDALGHCVDETARLEAARQEFDRQIAEGDAGPFERVDAQWWATLKSEVQAAHAARTRRKRA